MADPIKGTGSASGGRASGNWFTNAWNSVKTWFGNTFGNTLNTVNSAPSSLTKDNTLLDEIGEWAHNALTGERDYERQKEILEKEMAFNSSEAQKVRDYEERMSNTSYQRAVNDLISAGLNPGVAIGNGGAYTPTAYNASVGSHTVQRSGDQFSHLLSSMFGVFGTLINSSIRAKQIENKSYISDKMYDLRRDIFHSKSVKDKSNTSKAVDKYLKEVRKPEKKSSTYTLDELNDFFNRK